MSRFPNPGGGGPLRREGGYRPDSGGASITVLFDPEKPEQELYDTLAEQQARLLEINSSQLRKYFGETKDLYRQFNALTATVHDDAEKQRIYCGRIEARFKMLRSKVAYAVGRKTLQLDHNFAAFLQDGIKKVQNHQHFVRFVMHFEAVVGFMYGLGNVDKKERR